MILLEYYLYVVSISWLVLSILYGRFLRNYKNRIIVFKVAQYLSHLQHISWAGEILTAVKFNYHNAGKYPSTQSVRGRRRTRLLMLSCINTLMFCVYRKYSKPDREHKQHGSFFGSNFSHHLLVKICGTEIISLFIFHLQAQSMFAGLH